MVYLHCGIDRIELLLHIIRKLGGHGTTADKLKEVAGDTKRSLKHPSHVEIIYEILRVRKIEERFKRGEVGMCHQIHYILLHLLIQSQIANMWSMSRTVAPAPRETRMKSPPSLLLSRPPSISRMVF